MTSLRFRFYAWFFVCLFALLMPGAGAQSVPIDPKTAAQYVEEVRGLCQRDGGALWGVSLCGPVLFVDPGTRYAVANQADGEGKLRKEGDLFVGSFPTEINLGNTSLTWAGVKWTMLLWPLPEDAVARAALMAHELFHHVQDELGLPAPFVVCLHLDSKEGRIWLQLEWRALRSALAGSGADRRRAIQDALIFRAYRQQLFAKGAADERTLELNEGLAEYTGLKLRGTPDGQTMETLAKRLEEAQKRPSFVRQFAYESGPAYGYLLDAEGAKWRKGLKDGDDLGMVLSKALAFALPGMLREEAEKRLANYGGEALRAAETAREVEREKVAAEYRKKLVDGPVLLLPASGKVGLSFDPFAVISLGEAGTVYRTLRVTAEWGILEAPAGARLVREVGKISRIAVAAPADPSGRPLRGEGWTLELSSGWTIVAGERPGDYRVEKQK